jgi:hypothetical protein
MDDRTPRERLQQRWSSLKNERSTWDHHWREISDYLLPRSGRFFTKKVNDGGKRHNNIYDNTATRSLRVLSAGMMAGMTSPARPWFRLATADLDMMKSDNVKLWLNTVTRQMLNVFARSNTYRALHTVYEELGAFGTASNLILPDFNNVIHNHPLTIGEYALATNAKGEVDTIYREFEMTVSQVVEEFGYKNCSQNTRHMYDRGNYDYWITIIHTIEPRRERDMYKRDPKNMPFKSCYFEQAGDKYDMLRESGFEMFPAVAPRWSVTGGDIYGLAPAMEALGDIKQLQHEQLRKAQGIDYQTKPPLQVPTALKNQGVNSLPGGVTYVDATAQNNAIRSAFEVRLDLNHLLQDINDVRERIRGSFYADLFLMLANNDLGRMTATEVAERHEEKLLMLGPVLERLHNELLDPMIAMTFTRMVKAGVVPPPPPEMEGMDINVEFVSMLAQAQRAIGTNSVDRFVGNLGAIAGMKPEVLDKFDADKWADHYSDMLGIDPELITPDDQVIFIRQQRAQAAQAQAQQEALMRGADAMGKLGRVNTDPNNPNMATDAVNMFSGYTG